VAFLGLAFKPNVDDLRESPAAALARNLQGQGAAVHAYEPFRKDAEVANIQQVATLDAALIDADLIVLAVAHDQFKTLDPIVIRRKTRAELVYDAVNAWNKTAWEAAGFRFAGLARKY